MKSYIALAISFLLLISCGSDDKIIDNSDMSWELLAAVSSDPPSVMKIDNSGEILDQNIIDLIGEDIDQAPDKIAEFGGMLFLLFKENQKLIILNDESFEILNEFELPGTPSGICFPNATDAYISLENTNKVVILDIYNMKIARDIDVGNRPVNIAAYGNQVYLPLYDDNMVAVLDTRTKTVEALIPVPENPKYVDFTQNGMHAFVVSLGKGKLEDNEEKTKAFVSFINVDERRVLESTEIGFGSYLSENQNPTGLAVTNGDWAFIPTNEFIMRIDTRYGNRIRLMERGKFDSMIYNFKRDELVIIHDQGEMKRAYTADPIKANELESFEIPEGTKALLPL